MAQSITVGWSALLSEVYGRTEFYYRVQTMLGSVSTMARAQHRGILVCLHSAQEEENGGFHCSRANMEPDTRLARLVTMPHSGFASSKTISKGWDECLMRLMIW